MQRLLNDAQKISGVKYDMSNLSDVYNAIHVIQENMGVTGTTAKEASSTFTGSLASMKSAWSNLLGNMSTGGDVTGSMEALISSASTFLLDNAIPMIGNVFTALPSAIKTAISKSAPKIKEAGGDIVKSLKDGLIALLPSSIGSALESAFKGVGNIVNTMAPVVQQLGDMFGRVAPVIANTLGGAFGDGGGFIQGFADAISMAIPTVESILIVIADVVTSLAPVVSSIGSMFMAVLPVVLPIIQSLGSIIQQVFPIVSSVITMVLNSVMPIIQSFAGLIQSALPIVENIISVFCSVIGTIFPVVQQIFSELGSKISEIISGIIVPIVQKMGEIFQKISPVIQQAVSIVASVLSGAWSIISPILDLLMSTFKLVWKVLEPIIDMLVDAFVWLWDKVSPIFSGLADGLSLVGDAVSGLAGFIGDGIDAVAGWFGYAYGKDRVPYDNYPAMLHAGEKVLTRNQADQYERQMSTRGVQLTQDVAEVPRVNNTGNTTGNTGSLQEVQEVKKAGTTVNIEKLADTVVIEKEADVDRVVEDMINKFRKLVPNMA